MKVALFPGSFDPFTIAHLDLVERALPLFDKIVVAMGVNSSKQSLLSVEVRLDSLQELFEDYAKVEVQSFSGLTVDYCQQIGANYILRGLRNTNDFIFENAIAQNNLLLDEAIESYFLMSRSSLSHISSTIVRDILRNKGDVSHLLPSVVLKRILEGRS